MTSLKEEIDAIIFRCFAQGQYWGTEQDGKLNPDYEPEKPIDRSEALKAISSTISKHLPEKKERKADEEYMYCITCNQIIDTSEADCFCTIHNLAIDDVKKLLTTNKKGKV